MFLLFLHLTRSETNLTTSSVNSLMPILTKPVLNTLFSDFALALLVETLVIVEHAHL